MSRPQAVALTIFINLLWSTAGVVTRHLDSTASFEITFWRSSFNALALIIALSLIRLPGFLLKLLHAPKIIWISGVFWAIMFTAFMVALTLTTVANVLIIMALGPLITALFTRIFLKHRLPGMTWLATPGNKPRFDPACTAWLFSASSPLSDCDPADPGVVGTRTLLTGTA